MSLLTVQKVRYINNRTILYQIKTVGGFRAPAVSAFISFSDTAVFESGPKMAMSGKSFENVLVNGC